MMFNLLGNRSYRDCEGSNRREFLKVGALGMSSLGLSGLLRQRAMAKAEGRVAKDTSVVWIWLGGGATHIETFDPKMEAPVEFRSCVGAVKTNVPGIEIGGLFPKMAQRADQMAFIRSFAHNNSGHAGGTHYVMTGVDHPPADAGMPPIKPSFGSIAARVRGSNNESGIPTYVRLAGLYADGPNWLGAAYSPFDVGGEARNNMNINVDLTRLGDRRALLGQVDRINRRVDRSGQMTGLDQFETQAFDMILGRSKEAFDLTREDPRLRDKYNAAGTSLGDHLLTARRLCEAGAGFVTLHYANSYQGWDMHEKIEPQLKQACPPLDHAVATFLEDVAQRGMSEKILLVITGEFGRTPRINGVAGRDHWGPLCTLALAGGGLRMGQVVGESSAKAETPKSPPIFPKDLMATIFHVLGIDSHTQYVDPSGRPQYLLPEGARPIRELV
jgi:Protein of unknown function (DUF1501)